MSGFVLVTQGVQLLLLTCINNHDSYSRLKSSSKCFTILNGTISLPCHAYCCSVLDSFSPNLPSFRKAKGALNTAVGKPSGRPDEECVAVMNTAMPLAIGKLYLGTLEHPEVTRNKANTLVCEWGHTWGDIHRLGETGVKRLGPSERVEKKMGGGAEGSRHACSSTHTSHGHSALHA